ncbi:formate/nitrite transporter family protein [Frateuria aurantia]
MPEHHDPVPPFKLRQPAHPEEADDSIADHALTEDEREQVEETQPPRALVLHESIRRQGEEELARPSMALAWSALAAGLSMGFSLLARALLRSHLDDVPGGFLIENLGYTLGFVIVILGRQQLFTENTMTAVLPLLSSPRLAVLGRLLRLWLVVLAGNLLGVAIFAGLLAHTGMVDAGLRPSLQAICEEVMKNTPGQMFGKGIFSGWLIATMIWMVPAAPRLKLPIIVMMTYLIAIGGFTHVVVGSCEVLYLVWQGQLDLSSYALEFALPTLAGNVVGGSFIFALISHVQVRSEHGREGDG